MPFKPIGRPSICVPMRKALSHSKIWTLHLEPRYQKEKRRHEDYENSDVPLKPILVLSTEATEYLVDWFIDNIHYPYPTTEQKKEMRRVTGQTRKQLDQWFENHRQSKRKGVVTVTHAAHNHPQIAASYQEWSLNDPSLHSVSAPLKFPR